MKLYMLLIDWLLNEFLVTVPMVVVAKRGSVATEEAEVEVDRVVVVVEEAIMVTKVVALTKHVRDEFIG